MDSQELAKTILLQYASSPKLRAIIEKFNAAMGIEGFINDFYDLIWNIDTADYYGLNVWGKIVNVSRFITVDIIEPEFGFHEALAPVASDEDPQPFDQGTFHDGVQSTSTIELSNDAYRRLIMTKAMANITDCSIPDLNKMLRYLFSDQGQPFITDHGDMSVTYVFWFDLSASDFAIIARSGVLARATGVLATIMSYDPDATFGFSEADMEPFDQGVFFSQEQIRNVD